MCELYGFCGKKKKVLNDELEEFFSHSDKNPNGWGIAVFGNNSNCSVQKEPLAANKSEDLKKILKRKIEQKNVLAHIRLATVGYDEYNNSHPFTGKDISGKEWAMIHNGTIFESDVLSPYLYLQKGSTDSERVFLYFLDKINEAIAIKGSPLNNYESFEIFDSLVSCLSDKNKLNLIVCDGTRMYVHCNCQNTLYMKLTDKGITFSTKPLSKHGWESVPFTRAFVCENGEIVSRGTKHNFEYIPDESSLRALYMAYAAL